MARKMNSVKSILLIDDDQDDKYFFATALEEVDSSIRLHTASNGAEALEKLSTLKPDMILLDLVMPKMSGLAFLKAMRKQNKINKIPVLIYTADLSVFDEGELRRMGAGEVCIKPVDYEGTVNKIRELLNHEVYLKSA